LGEHFLETQGLDQKVYTNDSGEYDEGESFENSRD